MNDYRILQWDSVFFGFPVALITLPRLTAEQLMKMLSHLKQKKVRLVYWPAASSGSNITRSDAQALGGHFVDEKTTFLIEFASAKKIEFSPAAKVERYSTEINKSDMEVLAIQSSKYSRYAIDPNMPQEKSVEMYKIWIDRSVKKEIANEVLIIREGTIVAGMITLGEKNQRAEIGLIAVDRHFRCKKYSETLVHSAHEWFIKQGYKYGQVVTQGVNTPACNLYKKCGYTIERVENYYHFWL